MKTPNCRRLLAASAALSLAFAASAALDFDAGADLRIRQELVNNVPGLPNGGLVKTPYGHFTDHVRFRPRVWGELRLDTEDAGKWRIFTRLADEFRWNIEPYKSATTWPDELIIDNLYLEGTGLFGGFLDLTVGRRDLYRYGGVEHLFVDGTPGDGSRTVFSDMVTATLHFTEDEQLDLFGLHNADDNVLRWGTDRSKHRSLTSRYPGEDVDKDEWGYGAIWSGKVKGLAYRLFAMSKKVEHEEHVETVGARVMPRFTDTLSGEFEAMSQLNREWSGYAALQWKDASASFKPMVRGSLHFMSKEWDPMWARAVNDSEMFLYGAHNGVAWWSNMIFLKFTAGVEFSYHHSLTASTGPMFAYENDDAGGGNGCFKGELSQVKYAFPIYLGSARRSAGPEAAGGSFLDRFEVVGHFLFELLNPGDYYSSSRPAWFFRWQLEFCF